MTETGPHFSYVDRSAERVVVWSPPRVIILGTEETSVVLAIRDEMIYDQDPVNHSPEANIRRESLTL